jgi:hypothetical protein
VQRGHGQFLLVEAVGRDLPALAVEDELVGAVPVLDDVQPLVDLAPPCLGGEIPAQEDGLDRLPELGQRLVGGVLRGRAGEASEDRLGLSGPQAWRSSVLDELVVLLPDQLPVDRPLALAQVV